MGLTTMHRFQPISRTTISAVLKPYLGCQTIISLQLRCLPYSLSRQIPHGLFVTREIWSGRLQRSSQTSLMVHTTVVMWCLGHDRKDPSSNFRKRTPGIP